MKNITLHLRNICNVTLQIIDIKSVYNNYKINH